MAVGRVGSSLLGIVLARILAPDDYGVYAVALVALNAVLSVNELGVSLAIVRWPGDVSRIAPTVATLSLASSALLYVGSFLAAPWVATRLGSPEATGVLRLLTLGVLVDAVTAVPAALMTRGFQQRRRLVVDTVAFFAVAGVSLTLALLGFGAWSLAWGTFVGSVVNGVVIVLWAPVRHGFGWRQDVVGELLAFGLPLAAASLLVFGMLNVDYVIVGHELGSTQLGFYLLAFNLSSWPVTLFSAPVRRVSLAAFSRLAEEPGAAMAGFVRACVLLLAAAGPACLLLSVFATPLIGFVYGEKWLPAAGPLPFLSVLALARVMGELAYDFLVALGRSRSNLAVQGLWLASLVPALLVGVSVGGIEGVAIAHALVAVLVVAPAFTLLLRRSGLSVRDIVVQLVRPVAGLVLAGVSGLLVLWAINDRFMEFAVGGLVVVVVYGLVVAPMRRLVRGDDQADRGDDQAGRGSGETAGIRAETQAW